jgi:hypothetical protein
MEAEYELICDHCGFNTSIQPPREEGCNHVYYPEACKVCSEKAKYEKVIINYDLKKITHKARRR